MLGQMMAKSIIAKYKTTVSILRVEKIISDFRPYIRRLRADDSTCMSDLIAEQCS